MNFTINIFRMDWRRGVTCLLLVYLGVTVDVTVSLFTFLFSPRVINSEKIPYTLYEKKSNISQKNT